MQLLKTWTSVSERHGGVTSEVVNFRLFFYETFSFWIWNKFEQLAVSFSSFVDTSPTRCRFFSKNIRFRSQWSLELLRTTISSNGCAWPTVKSVKSQNRLRLTSIRCVLAKDFLRRSHQKNNQCFVTTFWLHLLSICLSFYQQRKYQCKVMFIYRVSLGSGATIEGLRPSKWLRKDCQSLQTFTCFGLSDLALSNLILSNCSENVQN